MMAMEEDKTTSVEFPTTTHEAIDWIRETLANSVQLTDAEVDDTWTMVACEKAQLHPAVSAVLTTPRKDTEALSLKLNTMGTWLNAPFGTKSNLVMDLNAPPSADFLKLVKLHCLDRKTGRLKIFSTAPSAQMLHAFLQDQELATAPWDIVCYTGAYNIQVDAQVNLLTTLYKKLISGDGSRMYMAQWYTGMGQGKEGRLRNLSTLLGDDDWKLIATENPSLCRFIEGLLYVFNKNLVVPANLFEDGKQGTQVTPPSILKAAEEAWSKTTYPEYVAFCQRATVDGVSVWNYVKNKKKGILASVNALIHDAPLADMLIGLVISKRLEKCWKLCAGSLVVDKDMLNIVPVKQDEVPNVFELQLQLSEASVQAVHDEILELFCA